MKKLITLILMLTPILLFYAFTNIFPGAGNSRQSFTDSLKEEREMYIRQILDSLGDKKDRMADSVFRNVQIFGGAGGIKVTHFLGVMNYWGRALGVSCTYCHRTADWASDSINKKQIARDMYAMRVLLNKEVLPKIKGISTDFPLINCGTCHNAKTSPDRN